MANILKWTVKIAGFFTLILLAGCPPPPENIDGTGQSVGPGVNLVMSISSTGEITKSIPTTDDAKVDILFLDAASDPIVGEIINISASSGTLSQTEVLTGSDGRVTVTITSPVITVGTSPGIFTATPANAGEEGDTFRGAQVLNYQFVASTLAETPDEAAASVASLQFLSADPTILSLKGTGGVGYGEVSTLIFKVVDTENSPIGGAVVNFKLSTSVGGLALNKESGTTSANGEVQVTVQAGTVATPVRVTASVVTPTGEKWVQSDLLKIATGIPDQNSFTLSVGMTAPEGLNKDDTTVSFTVSLADQNNNPVPDGTVTVFTTEGGVIESSCETVAGVCSVTWMSQNPKPLDHRVTVLAYAIGNETFYDNNGNGVFDDGDSFVDLGEAFRDDDESGTFNPTINDFSIDEKLIDYNLSGNYTAGDGLYNGLPCNHTTDCPVDANNLAGRSNLLVNVRSGGVIIMASSNPMVHLYELLPGNSTCLDANNKLAPLGTLCQAVSPTFAVGIDVKNLWVLIEDGDGYGNAVALCKTSVNGTRIDGVVNPEDPLCLYAVRQSAPTGSGISVSTDVGEISGGPEVEVPDQIEALEFTFSVSSDDQNAEVIVGELSVVVTVPSGNEESQLVFLTDPPL